MSNRISLLVLPSPTVSLPFMQTPTCMWPLFCLWSSHLSWFPETTWKHMLHTARYSLITHICCALKSQTPSTSSVAVGRGALLLPSPLDKSDPEHSSPCMRQLRWKHRGFLGKRPQLQGAGVYTSSRLWPRPVRNGSAFCCSAAFLCITRTNEDLITDAWPLFVCFCAPVLFLSPHGPPLSGPCLLHTHAEHTQFPAIWDASVYSVEIVWVMTVWEGKMFCRYFLLFVPQINFKGSLPECLNINSHPGDLITYLNCITVACYMYYSIFGIFISCDRSHLCASRS